MVSEGSKIRDEVKAVVVEKEESRQFVDGPLNRVSRRVPTGTIEIRVRSADGTVADYELTQDGRMSCTKISDHTHGTVATMYLKD